MLAVEDKSDLGSHLGQQIFLPTIVEMGTKITDLFPYRLYDLGVQGGIIRGGRGGEREGGWTKGFMANKVLIGFLPCPPWGFGGRSCGKLCQNNQAAERSGPTRERREEHSPRAFCGAGDERSEGGGIAAVQLNGG